jgi:hypothetical protein
MRMIPRVARMHLRGLLIGVDTPAEIDLRFNARPVHPRSEGAPGARHKRINKPAGQNERG